MSEDQRRARDEEHERNRRYGRTRDYDDRYGGQRNRDDRYAYPEPGWGREDPSMYGRPRGEPAWRGDFGEGYGRGYEPRADVPPWEPMDRRSESGGGGGPQFSGTDYGFTQGYQFGRRTQERDMRGWYDTGNQPIPREQQYEPRGGQRWGRDDRARTAERSFRGMGPRGYRRSDDRIREDICDRLCDHDELDASELSCEVRDGEVTLEGHVPVRRMKYLAEDIACSVSGVHDVLNHLRIHREGEAQRTNGRGEREAARGNEQPQRM